MKKRISLILCAILVIALAISSMLVITSSAAEETATISFANKAQRTAFSTTQQIWEQNGIKVTNNKGASTTNVGDYANPGRFYKSSTVIVEYPGMTSITFEGSGDSKYKTPIEASIKGGNVKGTVSVSGNNYTITFASPVDSFEFVTTAQIRFATISLTYQTGGATTCTHENAYDLAIEATCKNGAGTVKWCPDCEKEIADPVYTSDPLDHKDEDNDLVCDFEGCEVLVNVPAADSELTIKQAISLGKYNGQYTEGKYYVTGTIKEVYNTTYGNMYLVDEDGNEFTIYGTYSNDGTVRYDAMGKKPVAGEVVTLYGIIGQYNGTPQMKDGWLITDCDHIWDAGVETKAPNCTEDGVKTYTCSECGETYTETIKALGHDNEIISSEDASCSKEGKIIYECAACGHDSEEIIEKLAHNYVDGICTVCGAEMPLEETVVFSTLGYANAEDMVEITLGENGFIKLVFSKGANNSNAPKYYDKSTAGRMYVDNTMTVVIAEGYKVTAVIFEFVEDYATDVTFSDTDEGYVCTTAGTCRINSVTVKYEKLDTHKHTEGEVQVENKVDANCTTAGSYENVVYCTECGEELSRVKVDVDALGHTLNNVEAKDPTCTEDGYKAYEYCSVCDYTTFEKVDATGHSYDENGVCANCGDVKFFGAFEEVRVNVGAQLALKYLVKLPADADVADYTVVFTFNNREFVATAEAELLDGYYVFMFKDIAPQLVTANVAAKLYKADKAIDEVAEYSVKKNLLNVAAAGSEKLQTLVADLLNYAAAAQAYLGMTVDANVDVPYTGTTADVAAIADMQNSGKADATLYFKSGSLIIDNVNRIVVTVYAENLEGVKVLVNGVEAAIYEDKENVYKVFVNDVTAADLANAPTFELVKDGETVQSITYGAYTYVKRIAGKSGNDAMKALALALYNYGESVKAYLG